MAITQKSNPSSDLTTFTCEGPIPAQMVFRTLDEANQWLKEK